MSTLEQRQDEVVDPLDREFAPGWAPEPGDKIRGKLTQRDERDGGFGAYPIYTLALADGYQARIGGGLDVRDEVAVHASRDVLRRKLANARLELGDEVGIRYEGPPRGSARSHRYRVLKFAADGSHAEVAYDQAANERGGGQRGKPGKGSAPVPNPSNAVPRRHEGRDEAMSMLHAPLESEKR